MTALQTITVNEQELAVREYNAERVVTFKDIDRVHGRPIGTAKRTFLKNKKYFREGVDFTRLERDEIRSIGIQSPNGTAIVLTESGYLMLVKSFHDKLAWDVQRKLVDTYFHKQPEQLTMEDVPAEEYQYTEKYFRGKQVITLRDLEHFTGITKSAASHHIKNRKRLFRFGEDYWILQNLELAEFKTENPCAVNPSVPRLFILAESGCRKLLKLIQNTPKPLECFRREIPVPKEEEPKPEPEKWKREVVKWSDAATATKRIRKLDELLTSARTVLKLLNMSRTENEHISYINTLTKLAMDAYVMTSNIIPHIEITKEFQQ